MTNVFLFIFCGLVVLAFTLLIVSSVCIGRVKENRRKHQLGRLLKCSHPEWN